MWHRSSGHVRWPILLLAVVALASCNEAEKTAKTNPPPSPATEPAKPAEDKAAAEKFAADRAAAETAVMEKAAAAEKAAAQKAAADKAAADKAAAEKAAVAKAAAEKAAAEKAVVDQASNADKSAADRAASATAAAEKAASQQAASAKAAADKAAAEQAASAKAAADKAAAEQAASAKAAADKSAADRAASAKAAAEKAAAEQAASAKAAADKAAADQAASAKAAAEKAAAEQAAAEKAAAEQAAKNTKVTASSITNWGYWLQNDDPDAVAASPYDLIVIDYSRNGAPDGVFTKAEIAKMKKKPDGGRRLVICYISIGEAEDYRFYWDEQGWGSSAKRKGVVDAENPEWRHNYSVRYWKDGWQNVILNNRDSYINRIMDVGFDGIYLDKIDVSDDYANKKSILPADRLASDLMVQFVRKISTVTKQKNPDFLIIAQNAEGLLDDDSYRVAIDGIGKESLLFYEKAVLSDDPNNLVANDEETVAESIRLLKKLKDDNKLVMVVEYLSRREHMQIAANTLGTLGYVYYFGPRDLAKLAPPPSVILKKK